jgi:asparagine synthase (glutamine-hydrolysing)
VCGIAGTLDLRPGLGSAEELVSRMTDEIAHRGPDGAGMFVLPPVVLGNRRLSILDLSPTAHQPMGSEDGDVWLTYNGRSTTTRSLRRTFERAAIASAAPGTPTFSSTPTSNGDPTAWRG